jgi:hypothetical protein
VRLRLELKTAASQFSILRCIQQQLALEKLRHLNVNLHSGPKLDFFLKKCPLKVLPTTRIASHSLGFILKKVRMHAVRAEHRFKTNQKRTNRRGINMRKKTHTTNKQK